MFLKQYNMTENPNDWRSAVDPTTGRTYWYHRKTRISSWNKPDFIENDTTIKNVTDSNEERNNTAKNIDNADDRENHNISLKNIIQKIANNSNQLVSNEINKILKHLIIDISGTFFNAHETISDLIYIIIHSTNIISRQVTLRMLCILTQNHYLTSEQFGTNQSWIILIKFINKWSDVESTLLLIAFYCNLMIGTTCSLITEDMKSILINRIKDLTEKKDLMINLDLLTYQLFDESNPSIFLLQDNNVSMKQPQIKFAVLNDVTIQSYLILVEKGHHLPVVWLLAVFNQFTKSNKLFTHIIEMGYVQVLHLICINSKVHKDWKVKAKSQLLNAMSSSPYIQESVLDAFIDFAKDLSEISVSIGPEPIIYETTCMMMNMTQQQTSTSRINTVDSLNSFITSDKYFEECLENGHCDVIDSVTSEENVPEYAENWELLNRDIEWIPSSGTRWRLSSILIWTRCPALRELINEFWEGGGGGLELSIDACDQVLACICRYIHTGYLMPPITLNQQLELLRVSCELGMNSLHNSISKTLLQQVTMLSVSVIIEFCASNGYSALEQNCRSYLATGIKQSEIKFINHESNHLKDAIFASLQDVNEVLAEGNLIPISKKPNTKIDTEIKINEEKLLNLPENYKIYTNTSGTEYTTNIDTSLFDIAAGLNDMTVDIVEDRLSYDYSDSVGSDINNSNSFYSKNQNSAVKSGGIYGMLLRDNMYDDLTEHPSNKQTIHHSATKIPGRVMGNKKQSTLSSNNKKTTSDFKNSNNVEKIEASEFLVKYNQSTVSEEFTPTTKRVSNLLANARPSIYKCEENPSDNQFSNIFDTSMASDFDGPQEFVKPMSLAPVRELTAVEKKLERLTRPTKVLGVKNKLNNKVIVTDEDETDISKSTTNESYLNKTEVVLIDVNEMQSMKQPNTTLVELKRSISPSTPNSSRDEHAIIGLGMNNNSYDNINNINNDVFNVRGSLTLLKTKTASRRRRSIAEIEDAQNNQQAKDNSDSAVVVISETSEITKEKVQKDILSDNTEDNLKGTEDLLQCPDCSRRFNYEPFQKHIKICAQVFIKKRKAFDSTQMRVQANPDLLNFLEGSDNISKKKSNKNPIKTINGKNNNIVHDISFKKNWKEESNAFRKAMQAARQVSAAIASGAPLPPPTLSAPDPSLILCPHCSRRFNAKAADRHIPQCQNIIAKPSSLKRGAGLNASKGLNNTITPAKSKSWQ